MPIKRIGSYDGQLRSDLFLMHLSIATSEYFADLVAKSFYLPRHRVLVTGLPRNEWLFQFEDRYRALKEGRSTLVAWLPTYRSTRHSTTLNTVRKDSGKIHPDPLDVETLEKLDGFLDGSDTVLIIKLHVLDQKNEVSWARYENIRLYTHSRFQAERLNLYKLLAVSDALVTDYSSCAIDYLLLKRPIGIFAPDKSSYSRGFMPGVMEKLAAQTYPLRCVEEFGSFMTHIPQMHLVSDGSDLHQMDLRSPSKAILSAVGLR
jgi:CDP-glycerol glycerophosphotransferase (TagB/SpsB family)